MHISPLKKTISKSVGEYYAEHGGIVSRSDRFYMSVADGTERLSYGRYEYQEQEAYAELAIGGHTVTVKPQRPLGMSGGAVGGVRGEVTEYSRQSRNRLLRLIGRTDKFKQPVFVTLTYPDVYSVSKDRWKRDIDTFGKRLIRRWAGAAFVWRIEFKERKSGENQGVIMPHYHLLVWGVPASDLVKWVGESWYELCDSGDERHLRAGTSVERLRSWNGVISYVSKYLAKVDKFPDGWTGRVWGVVGRKNVPWAVIVVIPLANDVAIKLVRLGRKFCRLRGKTLVNGITWLMGTEAVMDYIEILECFA